MLPFLFIFPDRHGALPRTTDLAMNGIVISSAMGTNEAEEAHGLNQTPATSANSQAPLSDNCNSRDSIEKKRQAADIRTTKVSSV